MDTTTRGRRSTDRAEVRARVRGPRRFRRAEAVADAGPPPFGGDGGLWPRPGKPSGSNESGIQWPFWIVLLVPWLTLTAAFLLEHFRVCLMCVPDSVPLPP